MRTAWFSSWPSGVHLGAVAEVEADRLHHPERRALGVDVRGGDHAGVLLDHGRGRYPGDLVQVALHRRPRVLAVLDEVARWVHGVDRLPGVLGDVVHVPLMKRHVVPGAEPTVVTAEKVRPR